MYLLILLVCHLTTLGYNLEHALVLNTLLFTILKMKYPLILKGSKPCSVQSSCSVMSDSLWPHGLQHVRLPCPTPTPGAYSMSQCCHPTISSSVVLFSSCLQSFLASGLFQWVSSSHQVAKVLEFQLQHQSFQWISRTDFL